MPMETRSSKVFFQIYRFKKTAEKILVPPLLEKKRKMFDFLIFSPPTAAINSGAICFFWLQIVNTVIETNSCDDRRSIST